MSPTYLRRHSPVLSASVGMGGFLVLAASATAAVGCGSSSTEGTPVVDGGGPFRPAASCPVVIDTPARLDSPHVSEGTAVTYSSNPPSSGPHFPTWANFQEFDVPVEDGYLVHTLEHGGVLLLYKCEGAQCGPIVEGLRKIRDEVATDPKCDPAIRVRVLIAPSPKITGPVAAAAWGWTYNAECLDAPTLAQFIKDNYARGPEDICAAGRTF